MNPFKSSKDAASLLIRIGLAFVLTYAAIAIHFDPASFTKYVPPVILDRMPIDLFLPMFGIGELFLSAWLLVGWKVKYPAYLTAFMMILIVVFNVEYFSVLFRNISICFSALGLSLLGDHDDRIEIRQFYGQQARILPPTTIPR